MYCNYDFVFLCRHAFSAYRSVKVLTSKCLTVNPPEVEPPSSTCGHDETPTDDHEWMEGASRQLTIPAEEEQAEAGMQHYAELDFAEKHPIPPPPSDIFVVAYAEVSQA